jgi:chorismate mutase
MTEKTMSTTDFTVDRSRIDELDDVIITLVRRRQEISREIQRRRTMAGDSLIAMGREEVVVNRYRTAFGGLGDVLAYDLLRVCRLMTGGGRFDDDS